MNNVTLVDEILAQARDRRRCRRDRPNDNSHASSSSSTSSSPPPKVCFVQQQHHHHGQETNRSSSSSSSSPLSSAEVMTYDDLEECISDHRRWLLSRQRLEKNNISDVQNDDDIVVAYLSTNTIDMVCSVLASTITSRNTDKESRRLVRPALLNTRWTVKEMVDALKPDDAINHRVVQSFRTLMLYDSDVDGMDMVAKEVSDRLCSANHSQDGTTLCHICECHPIPKLSKKYMTRHMSTGQEEPIKTLMTTEPSGTRTMESSSSSSSSSSSLNTNSVNSKDFYDDDDAVILFTSGTSDGKSKGVLLSHRALIIQSYAKTKQRRINQWGYDTSTTMLATTVPLFHVGGLSSFLAVLLAGGTLVWPPPPPQRTSTKTKVKGGSFRVQDIFSSVQHPLYPSNTLVVVPAMISAFFEEMTSKASSASTSANNNTVSTVAPIFPSMRLLLLGGQSATSTMIERMKYSFPNANLLQTYACTEAASSLTFLSLLDIDNTKMDSSARMRSADKRTKQSNTDASGGDCVGTPPIHIDLKLFRQNESNSSNIKDPSETRSIIRRPFEVGLIGSKGPHLMNGYWRRGQHVALAPMTCSSSYISGDLGYWDNRGQLYFSGRVKDVIRTGGETVMAQEVESIIVKHPQVQECAVFARQDEKYGEAVSCAFVPKHSNPQILPSLTNIKDWCRSKGLAGYKHPKFLFVVKELPKNSSGKVLRFKLVEIYGKPFRSKL